MKRTIVFKVTLVAVLGLGPAFAHAQDISAGESTYKSVCKNCHGPTAKGMASFPKLSGSTAEYLVSRLEQYRAKEKIGPNSPLMWPLAVDMSDEDIANVAAYIATTFE